MARSCKTSRLRRNEIDNEIIRQKYQEVLKHTYWKDKHHSNRVFYKIVKERGLTYVIVNRIDLCNEKYQHEMSWPKDNMVSYSEPCCREEYMVALSHIKEKWRKIIMNSPDEIMYCCINLDKTIILYDDRDYQISICYESDGVFENYHCQDKNTYDETCKKITEWIEAERQTLICIAMGR